MGPQGANEKGHNNKNAQSPDEKAAGQNLFDSFYTHFLLRDFIGKILPGALVVFAFAYTVPSFRHFVEDGLSGKSPSLICTVREIPFVVWLFLGGAFWTAGVAVQRLGDDYRSFGRFVCRFVSRGRRWQRQKAKISGSPSLPKRCSWFWKLVLRGFGLWRRQENRSTL